jgi:hypothetical protein
MSETGPATDDPDLAERALRRQKREDAALALPFLGVLLLVSPILNAVTGFHLLLGIPAPVFYIFFVWVFLIVLAARLARVLKDH